jgi:Ca-activated chloride channel homolog
MDFLSLGVKLRALLFVVLSFTSFAVLAQTSDEVHITPHVQEKPILPPPTAGVPTLAIRSKPLRVDVDLVLVPVTVTDVSGKSVMDLRKDDFKLFEAEQEIPVRYFFAQDTPISVGVVVDLSSSMKNKLDRVRQAFDEFFNNADPADDYFVVTFADRPHLLSNTTESILSIQNKLALMEAKGNTALADAIYLSLLKLHNAKYQRRALVIISDGGDNASRNSLRKVKNLAKEADAQVYAIDVCDAPSVLFTRKIEERFGKQWLSQVSEVSGGRTIAVDDSRKIPEAAAQISLELRNQYVLGFRPSNVADGNKWRKIKVRVARKEDQPQLQVYYKTGYMAVGN